MNRIHLTSVHFTPNWKRVEQAMVKVGIKEPLLSHIQENKDVEVLARNVQDWLKGTKSQR